MTQANSRHLKPAPVKKISTEDAKALLAKYDTSRRSCLVQKLGLQHVVESLAAQKAGGTVISRILSDKEGDYKEDVGIGPITNHIHKRCACYPK